MRLPLWSNSANPSSSSRSIRSDVGHRPRSSSRPRTLALSVALLGFISAAVPAATVWQPTDQNVNAMDLYLIVNILPSGNFYIFDDDAAGNLGSAPNLPLATSDLLTFTQNGLDWDIMGTNGTLTVTGTPNFLFAESNNSGFSQESSSSPLGPNNWRLVFGSGAQLQAVDVTPIPLPPAVLLLGSGLFGLACIARRRTTG